MSEQATVLTEQEVSFGGDQFKEMLKVVSSIVDEVLLSVSNEGIKIACVDPAHISMFQIVAPKEAFDKWQATGNFDVGLDTGRVLKALARCGTYSGKVRMTAKKVVVSGSSKRFTLTAVDTTGMSVPKVPDLKLSTEFDLAAEALRDAVKDVAVITDHIAFSVKGGELSITARGDLSNYEQPIKVVLSGSECRSVFPLDYLEKFSKVMGAKVKVKMSNDYPIMFKWTSDDFDYQTGKLRKKGIEYTFLLAPRIEADEDEPRPSKPAPKPTAEAEDEVEIEADECDECDICDESEGDYSEEEGAETEA